MTPAEVLEAFRVRDVRLTVVGDRLHVDAPVGELTAADRELLAASKPALLRLLADEGRDGGTTVATAVDVFPGARVVQDGQPPVWPPAGGWIPSSALDPCTSASPTGACPVCAGSAWHWAGGWVCARCHPAPGDGARPTGSR